jgi:hypothetical protein
VNPFEDNRTDANPNVVFDDHGLGNQGWSATAIPVRSVGDGVSISQLRVVRMEVAVRDRNIV